MAANEIQAERCDTERLISAAALLIDFLMREAAPNLSNPVSVESGNQEESIMTAQYTESQGEWITPDQAAEMIGTITSRTVAKWARQGLIPSVQVNRRWYVSRAKLLEMLNFYQGDK
jgi:hypothetical protein